MLQFSQSSSLPLRRATSSMQQACNRAATELQQHHLCHCVASPAFCFSKTPPPTHTLIVYMLCVCVWLVSFCLQQEQPHCSAPPPAQNLSFPNHTKSTDVKRKRTCPHVFLQVYIQICTQIKRFFSSIPYLDLYIVHID